jgi:hypothetical protein
MTEEIIQRYGQRVGYSGMELKLFREGGHRVRQVERLSKAAILLAHPCTSHRNCAIGFWVNSANSITD